MYLVFWGYNAHYIIKEIDQVQKNPICYEGHYLPSRIKAGVTFCILILAQLNSL